MDHRVNDASHIFLLGIGDAYLGIMTLLNEHRSAADDVTATIAFVGENALRAVTGDDERIRRYYNSSMIFVANDHPVFDQDARKLKRRHGGVVRSQETRLQKMLLAHRETVFERLTEATTDWRRKHTTKAAEAPVATFVPPVANLSEERLLERTNDIFELFEKHLPERDMAKTPGIVVSKTCASYMTPTRGTRASLSPHPRT